MSRVRWLAGWVVRLYVVGCAGTGVLIALMGDVGGLVGLLPLLLYFAFVTGRSYLRSSRSESAA